MGLLRLKEAGWRRPEQLLYFLFFYFFTYEKICGHYCPHCGSPTVQIVGEINSNSIFTLSMLHFPAVASHTPLLCFESVCHFFFFFFWNKRCFTPPLTQEHTLAYFFFFFPETDPGIVKQRRDGSPVLFVWHLDKVRSNAEIGASPSPTPPSLLQPRSSQAYKLEEVQRNQAQLALLSRELLCNASKMER